MNQTAILWSCAFVASDRLRPEQKHAVEFVLASRDHAVALRTARNALVQLADESLAILPKDLFNHWRAAV